MLLCNLFEGSGSFSSKAILVNYQRFNDCQRFVWGIAQSLRENLNNIIGRLAYGPHEAD